MRSPYPPTFAILLGLLWLLLNVVATVGWVLNLVMYAAFSTHSWVAHPGTASLILLGSWVFFILYAGEL